MIHAHIPVRLALVYQAGIANVFRVEQFSTNPALRGPVTRLRQGTFTECLNYIQGATENSDCETATYSCNVAGDCARVTWTVGTEACVFRDSPHCVDYRNLDVAQAGAL